MSWAHVHFWAAPEQEALEAFGRSWAAFLVGRAAEDSWMFDGSFAALSYFPTDPLDADAADELEAALSEGTTFQRCEAFETIASAGPRIQRLELIAAYAEDPVVRRPLIRALMPRIIPLEALDEHSKPGEGQSVAAKS